MEEPNKPAPMFEVFAETDDPVLQKLCHAYWECFVDDANNIRWRRTTTELATEYDINKAKISKRVSARCFAIYSPHVCSRCSSSIEYRTRSAFQGHASKGPPFTCQDCLREEAEERDQERQRQAAEERKRSIALMTDKRARVEAMYAVTFADRELDVHEDLSFEQAVYLMSVARAAASEDMLTIEPISAASPPLSPTPTLDMAILGALHSARVTGIHPVSELSAFVFDEEGLPTRAYFRELKWFVWRTKNETPGRLMGELEAAFRNGVWADEWFEEWMPVAKTVALHECLQYLDVSLREHSLDLQPGEKTHQVLEHVLENFSVAQVYNMIWRAVRDAAAFYVRESVSARHAANTVVGAIQRYADRALAEQWSVKPYGRDRKCPQSVVSQTLFDAVLHVGPDGFNVPPRLLRPPVTPTRD